MGTKEGGFAIARLNYSGDCKSPFLGSFIIPNSVNVALVTLGAFEFLHVFVGLLFTLAAMLLNDLPQSRVHVLGHAARIAANKKVGPLRIDPLPNLRCVFQHLVLDVGFIGLIA